MGPPYGAALWGRSMGWIHSGDLWGGCMGWIHGNRCPQRLESRSMGWELRQFGVALDGTEDLNGDGLPDIAVGTDGRVAILRCLWGYGGLWGGQVWLWGGQVGPHEAKSEAKRS